HGLVPEVVERSGQRRFAIEVGRNQIPHGLVSGRAIPALYDSRRRRVAATARWRPQAGPVSPDALSGVLGAFLAGRALDRLPIEQVGTTRGVRPALPGRIRG